MNGHSEIGRSGCRVWGLKDHSNLSALSAISRFHITGNIPTPVIPTKELIMTYAIEIRSKKVIASFGGNWERLLARLCGFKLTDQHIPLVFLFEHQEMSNLVSGKSVQIVVRLLYVPGRYFGWERIFMLWSCRPHGGKMRRSSIPGTGYCVLSGVFLSKMMKMIRKLLQAPETLVSVVWKWDPYVRTANSFGQSYKEPDRLFVLNAVRQDDCVGSSWRTANSFGNLTRNLTDFSFWMGLARSPRVNFAGWWADGDNCWGVSSGWQRLKANGFR